MRSFPGDLGRSGRIYRASRLTVLGVMGAGLYRTWRKIKEFKIVMMNLNRKVKINRR
jgi:hypothetical protein